jgi:hypothetical protein
VQENKTRTRNSQPFSPEKCTTYQKIGNRPASLTKETRHPVYRYNPMDPVGQFFSQALCASLSHFSPKMMQPTRPRFKRLSNELRPPLGQVSAHTSTERNAAHSTEREALLTRGVSYPAQRWTDARNTTRSRDRHPLGQETDTHSVKRQTPTRPRDSTAIPPMG